jgi:hypothetical protein
MCGTRFRAVASANHAHCKKKTGVETDVVDFAKGSWRGMAFDRAREATRIGEWRKTRRLLRAHAERCALAR